MKSRKCGEFIRKYRPATLPELLGNDKTRIALHRLVERGIGGRRLLFAGESGTGKTTLARILADGCGWTEEINGADVNAGWIDHFARALCSSSLFGGLKCFIINEAQRLNKAIQDRLLTLIEDMPESNVVVFTTTEIDRLQPAFLGRCMVFYLETPSAGDLAKLAALVVKKEGGQMRFVAAERLAREAAKQRTGYRGVLQLLEQAALAGAVSDNLFAA